MPYCSNCGQSVQERARFCSNCGQAVRIPHEREGAPADRSSVLGLDDVPWWLGWLAVPIGLLLSVIGVGLYSYWAYRRGRRDGAGREATEEPYEYVGRKAFGWGLATLVPILSWYASVHLPTLCYKHGLRVGAGEGTAGKGFTSLPAVGVALVAPLLAVFAVAFAVGFLIAFREEISEEKATTLPPPPAEEIITAAFLLSDVLELTQQQVVDGTYPLGPFTWPADAKYILCLSAQFQPENLLWIVRCKFYDADPLLQGNVVEEKSYIFDDATGQVMP